jgi:hypothetical protein
MDTGRCPEMSRDSNGLTGIAELRFYLTRLGMRLSLAIQSQSLYD